MTNHAAAPSTTFRLDATLVSTHDRATGASARPRIAVRFTTAGPGTVDDRETTSDAPTANSPSAGSHAAPTALAYLPTAGAVVVGRPRRSTAPATMRFTSVT